MRTKGIPKSEFERRLSRVRGSMEKSGLELLIIFSSPGSMRYGQRGHVMYLSGYEPYFGDTMMILPLESDLDPLLQIDSADFFPSKCTWIKEIVSAQDYVSTIRKYVSDGKVRASKIGIAGEYSASPALLDQIRKNLRLSRLRFSSDIIEDERSVKSEFEIKCIRKASSIAKKGFERAEEFTRAGVTEAEIVAEVERVCRLAGSEGFPHRTMVSSGADLNHLEWWWYCGRRKLRRGDPWNLDFGTMYGGYCCDIARSFSLGRPKREHRESYDILVEAEEAARELMRPGVRGSEVNDAVIAVMSRHFEGDFTGIGHGVGLEVHEWPFVGYQYIRNDPVYADCELRENMVLSVEPQVFLTKFGYIQIEDEFLVTRSGGKRLSNIRRGLLGG